MKTVAPAYCDEYGDLPLFRMADPKVRDSEETPRLSAQCQLILDRLKRSRATNKELAALSLKYTSRISDLRASGYDVIVVDRDHKSGLTIYELKGPL